jgi:hypothetical protein
MILRALGAGLGRWTASFDAALDDPEAAQARVAQALHDQLIPTAIGRHDGLRPGGPALDGVPVRTWEEVAPFAAAQVRGEPGLSLHPTRFVERTSGSSGRRKEVPWTDPMRSTLSWMFLVWVGDLLRHGPPLRRARAWLATTPPLVPAGEGVPGALDDTDYLSPWLRPLVRPFLVAGPSTRSPTDGPTFLDALARRLLAEPDLEVLSFWSPSLLLVLLDTIARDPARYGAPLNPRRRSALRADPVDWRGVWPRLTLVSCWRDGEAARDAARLDALLPGVRIQGKGLLATEGPMTLPLERAPAPVPLLDRVLIELLDDDGRLLPLHRAEAGATYEIVPSWPGGLVRYRIGDRVRVDGHLGATPCLRFVGRAGDLCDLVGEKLHASVIGEALAALLPDRWATVVPAAGPPPGYVVVTEQPLPADLLAAIDLRLREAWHYGQARALGQLSPLRGLHHPDARRALLLHRAGEARLGDAKDGPLVRRPADALLRALASDRAHGSEQDPSSTTAAGL